MSNNQYPNAPQPDFEVQVITLEHALSATIRGCLQLVGGALCIAFGWDFVMWFIQDFPNGAHVLLGPQVIFMFVQAVVAILGWFMMIEGKKKLLFVALVYKVDQWLGRDNAPISRRASGEKFE